MEKQIKFIFWNVHRNKDNISKENLLICNDDSIA